MSNPKTFSLWEPASSAFTKFYAKKKNIPYEKLKRFEDHQEDFLVLSQTHPIYAVADGVTMQPKKPEDYPIPSGAGEVAKIFCQTAVSELEKIYDEFEKKDLLTIFDLGNKAVGEYNKANGRTLETINYADFDLFAATVAFAVVCDKQVYWSALCDSFVAHFDKHGKKKFMSPDPWAVKIGKDVLKAYADTKGDHGKKANVRANFRNGLGPNDELIGYGVVTGEEAAKKYLHTDLLEVEAGDIVFLTTDGFSEYFDLPEFIKLFNDWPDDLEAQVKAMTSQKSKQDPNKFGHERSVIAFKF